MKNPKNIEKRLYQLLPKEHIDGPDTEYQPQHIGLMRKRTQALLEADNFYNENKGCHIEGENDPFFKQKVLKDIPRVSEKGQGAVSLYHAKNPVPDYDEFFKTVRVNGIAQKDAQVIINAVTKAVEHKTSRLVVMEGALYGGPRLWQSRFKKQLIDNIGQILVIGNNKVQIGKVDSTESGGGDETWRIDSISFTKVDD